MAELTRAEKIALLSKPPKIKLSREQKIKLLATGAIGPERKIIPTENKEHPMFGGLKGSIQRNIIHSFGNSPEEKAAKIKEINPEAKVRVVSGDVQVLAPGDEAWTYLDPPALEFEDITDVGFDAASAAANFLGGSAGAAAGSVLGPAGTLAGGLGGAALAGGATEAVKQGIGKLAGINTEFDTDAVKFSAALNAIGGGALGLGAKAASPLAKGTLKEVVESGILPTFGKKAAVGAGNYFTGVTSEVFERIASQSSRPSALMERLKKVTNIEDEKVVVNELQKIQNEGAQEFGQRRLTETFNKLETDISSAGKNIDDVVSNSNHRINLDDTFEEAKKAIESIASKSERMTPDEQGLINELAETLGEKLTLLSKNTGDASAITGPVQSSEAQAIKRSLDGVVNYKVAPGDTTKSSHFKRVQGLVKKVRNKLKVEIEDTIPGAKQANDDFIAKVKTKNQFIKDFSRGKTAENVTDFENKGFKNLLNVGRNKNDILKGRLEKIDPQLIEDSKNLAAEGLYSSKSFHPSGADASVTEPAKGYIARVVGTGLVGGLLSGTDGDNIGSRLGYGALGAAALTNPRLFKGLVNAAYKSQQRAGSVTGQALKNMTLERIKDKKRKNTDAELLRQGR